MGLAIYQPKGKAGEYAKYACNFYNGCSNGCEYCYLRKGVLAHTLGGLTPTLKKCFHSEHHAISVFFDELFDTVTEQPKADIKESGIFFSFSTDPCLPETQVLYFAVIAGCFTAEVPVQILTKCTEWLDTEQGQHILSNRLSQRYLAVGFTLTGHDELEPNAASNASRIEAMKRVHEMGIRTFASIEPIIDIDSSCNMIEKAAPFCNHFKVGILKGAKYDSMELADACAYVCRRFKNNTFYFKESLLKTAKIVREDISDYHDNCVGSDFNMFNNQK